MAAVRQLGSLIPLPSHRPYNQDPHIPPDGAATDQRALRQVVQCGLLANGVILKVQHAMELYRTKVRLRSGVHQTAITADNCANGATAKLGATDCGSC